MQLDSAHRTHPRHPRTLSPTEAVVATGRGVFDYVVTGLSVGGATLVGRHALTQDARVDVILRLPLYPEVRISAEVTECGTAADGFEVGVAFMHVDDRTEDHIQSALLSEIERSQSDGRVADIL